MLAKTHSAKLAAVLALVVALAAPAIAVPDAAAARPIKPLCDPSPFCGG